MNLERIFKNFNNLDRKNFVKNGNKIFVLEILILTLRALTIVALTRRALTLVTVTKLTIYLTP